MKKMFAVLMIAMVLMCFMPAVAFAEGEDVAKIGENTYSTLDEAVTAAEDGATITLLKDCSTEGLNLSKNIKIDGAGHKISFTKYGIALWGKSLTFENCTIEMTGIGSTPYTAEWNWQTICASKYASLTLNNTKMTMNGSGTAAGTHAIYFCSNNKLNLNSNSTLEIKNYGQDALEWDGGDGGYNVNITNSSFISDKNRSGFTGTFYATITNSKVDVINSTGNGSNGSHFIITDSEVNFNDNGAHGLSTGILTIDNSTVNAIGNGANGIHAGGKMEIKNNSKVSVLKNGCTISSKWTIPGALYVGGAGSSIDETCNVKIADNKGSGILVKAGASLDMKTGTVIRNTAEKLELGGGINNRGTVTLSKNVKLYNNHAATAGDDIYNMEGATITFGPTGSDWKLDGDPDCTDDITGWFDDSEGSRWEAHVEPRHIEELSVKEAVTVTGLKALKAAHGYYTVIYNDGVDGEVVFTDQVNSGLLYGTLTPEFKDAPKREGYVFKGWTPVVSERVTGNAYYEAIWEKAPVVPETGDTTSMALLIGLLMLAVAALAGSIFLKKSSTKK
ncbi:MAG: LPXTG cell wall anchor domain-containing protein [Anaerovoracaceae bacterium]